MLPSTFDIMCPMNQQSLILLYPMIKEKMHLKENPLFDLDLWVKATRNVAQCPLHHVTYAPTEFELLLQSTGPRSAVGKVSGNRCETDCRSRGREFDPGPVPYFRGD